MCNRRSGDWDKTQAAGEGSNLLGKCYSFFVLPDFPIVLGPDLCPFSMVCRRDKLTATSYAVLILVDCLSWGDGNYIPDPRTHMRTLCPSPNAGFHPGRNRLRSILSVLESPNRLRQLGVNLHERAMLYMLVNTSFVANRSRTLCAVVQVETHTDHAGGGEVIC